MAGRIFRRILAGLLLILAIFLGVKGSLRLIPGDPVDAILAETGANLDPEILRQKLGLDRPFFEAAASQLAALVQRFDWGRSIVRDEAIGPLLVDRTRASFALAITSLSGALLFSFFVSFFARTRRAARGLSVLAVALPTAWIGPLFAYWMAVKWRLFSLSGGIALPAITLATGLTGFWLRAFSETFDRELTSDVARTARAKGLGELAVTWKHVLLPAAGPLAAFLGSQTGALFAGAVITETLFDRPGLGSLLVEAIFRRDYPLIESTLIVSSVFILGGALVGDFVQELLDPKLRSSA